MQWEKERVRCALNVLMRGLLTPSFAFLVVAIIGQCEGVGTTRGRRSSGDGDDPRRVNTPTVPFALNPLQWGTVTPRGWIKDWAVAATKGSVSPDHAAFAHVHNGMPGVYVQEAREGCVDSTFFLHSPITDMIRRTTPSSSTRKHSP